MSARAVAFSALALVSGCVSAPDLAPPAPLPQAWSGDPQSGDAAVDAWWRASVADPLMADLIARAGAVNTVEEAAARVREARARVRATRAGLLPSLDASASAAQVDPSVGDGYDIEQASLDLSFDLDLFGATANRARARNAAALEAEAQLRLARIDARANAAALYIALRAAQAQKAAAASSAAASQESLDLAALRERAGLESGLAETQARAARDAARARTPQFQKAETESRLALEALLGLPAGALAAALNAPQPTPAIAADPLLATPAAVLAAHPEIAAAEARLARAGFNAAAARADLWPRISIGAALSEVAAPAGYSGAIDGSQAQATLIAPLFNFGRLRALAAAENEGAQAEAARLRQTVLDRIADVETQRARLRNAEARAAAQDEAVASARDAAQLALARYRAGLTNFLDVLTADRTLYDAQTAQAEAHAERARAAVALAAALGLGQGV